MERLKVPITTTDLILYHLLQRFIYQYHSMFSTWKDHPSLKEFTSLWFLKIFVDNPYFNNLQNSFLINYEVLENKDLIIVVRAPLFYKTFFVSLDKEITSCVTYTDNNGTTEDINIFSIDYEI
jgi:hypothetical protein